MRILQTFALSVALVTASAAGAFAQQPRGEGRIAGKVVDEQGQPLADVAVVATKKESTGQPPLQSKSNNKGEWTLAQLATGEWTLEFSKDGFQSQKGTVTIDESGNVPRCRYSTQTEHAIVNPGGTGTPRFVISARFAPLPPRIIFMSRDPSARPPPKK